MLFLSFVLSDGFDSHIVMQPIPLNVYWIVVKFFILCSPEVLFVFSFLHYCYCAETAKCCEKSDHCGGGGDRGGLRVVVE